MYHWYLLIRARRVERKAESLASGFVAGREPDWELSRAEKRRLFFLGGVETAPMVVGALLGGWVGTQSALLAGWLVGAVACAILCWLLRNYQLEFPISLKQENRKAPDSRAKDA